MMHLIALRRGLVPRVGSALFGAAAAVVIIAAVLSCVTLSSGVRADRLRKKPA
jgi:hypothetical protein